MSNSNYFSRHAHQTYKIRNTKKIATSVVAFIAVGVLSLGLLRPEAAHATVPVVNELISVDSSGTQGNSYSYDRNAISGNGNFITFTSAASNLVSGDTNGYDDIFVRDRTNNSTTRVSVSSTGTQANSYSAFPRISYDGRYITFQSNATNLTTGVTSAGYQVYVHDMQTGSTSLASSNLSGTVANNQSEQPDISADGRFVTFDSYGSNIVSGVSGGQAYVKDMSTGAVKALSVNSSGVAGNGTSNQVRISCDGNIVAFTSDATNLVAGDTNGHADVFVDYLGWDSDNLKGITLSGNNDSNSPSVSCNGNVIAYHTNADNIVTGMPSNPAQSIMSYNRLSNSTMIVSVNSAGTAAASTSEWPSVSDDGRYITFLSNAATALDSNRTYYNPRGNVFVRDTKANTTQVLTVGTSGQATGGSSLPNISADGSTVSYISAATEGAYYGLVASDSNGYPDTFVSQTGL